MLQYNFIIETLVLKLSRIWGTTTQKTAIFVVSIDMLMFK
jgi:hypothetical protein